MNILPIGHIEELDQPLFGASLFNLAKLHRANLPIPSGVAISPPEIFLQTVISCLETKDKVVLEQQLPIIKKELLRLKIPVELVQALKKHKQFYLEGQILTDINKLWQELLRQWLDMVIERFWNQGFYKGITDSLPARAVFFTQEKFIAKHQACLIICQAFFDPDFGEVVVQGGVRFSSNTLQDIDALVTQANKKLVIPQIYHLIVINDKPYITKIAPFTHTLPVSQQTDVVISKKEEKFLTKSAVKIFLNLSRGFTLTNNLDGVIIEDIPGSDYETMIFKLTEAALSHPNKDVIYRLPDELSKEVRGTLRLINDPKLLDKSCNTFLFARHKKNLLNVSIAIPLTRSVEEMLQLKRDLAAKNITRKGLLKIWWEVSIPENIVNLEEYLATGLDGIILDLNNLQQLYGGYQVFEGEFYKNQVATLKKVLEPFFKVTNKEKVPVIVKGSLSMHHELLDFLVSSGIWGIVTNNPLEAESLPEHLNWTEKRLIAKKYI